MYLNNEVVELNIVKRQKKNCFSFRYLLNSKNEKVVWKKTRVTLKVQKNLFAEPHVHSLLEESATNY